MVFHRRHLYSGNYVTIVKPCKWHLWARYAALGLIHDLNPSASGGAEIIEVDVDQEEYVVAIFIKRLSFIVEISARASGPESSSSRSDVRPNGSRSGDSIPKGYGRIIRDEDGNILRIELAEEEKNLSPAGNKNVDMEQLEPELDEAVKEKWIQDLGANGKRVLLKDNDRKDITGAFGTPGVDPSGFFPS
ncbi:ribosome biogenesis protein nop16 [Moniliophthora roreri]|nr:ribosome biogenesis protein nop16 [Moniliophthora roreri]